MQETIVKKKFGSEEIVISTGKLAKQADGSVMVTCGGTVVLVTACMSKEPREGIDFFPLTVEYQEKTYAAGRIPGGFFKREGRPSENEILTSRLIDRPIRPLFPKGLHHDVQVMAIVLSSDGKNDPDVLAVTGASAALSISRIPFKGPLAACRVARKEGNFIVNPSYEETVASDIDIIVAGTREGIMMLESRTKEVSEDIFKQGVQFGFEQVQQLLDLQDELCSRSKVVKVVFEPKKLDAGLLDKIKSSALNRLHEICLLADKESREEALDILKKELVEGFVTEEILAEDVKQAIAELEEEVVRGNILEKGIRVDGRGVRDIRQITCEISVLPRTHGSGLFVRGQTQSLAVTTLGTGEDTQQIEALEGETEKSFMLHYSFPPFSVGETAPVRGPGRREIGHGALAEKALVSVMPTKEEFPYTVRVVSEILESNGSSSMATVCAATLSLMDAGVPIKAPVAGVALGLIKNGNKHVVLTDIAGVEDHLGDMDFKVAGTSHGLTTVQLDVKLQEGITLGILEESLRQAQDARNIILGKMLAVIPTPRKGISTYAPRIEVLKIDTEKIGTLIGPSGKTIKKIIAATGVSVDIEDDGSVMVASNDSSAQEKAISMIKALVEDIAVGTIYPAKVKRIMTFGAFCELPNGKEGLVRVSELAEHFVKNVEDVVKIGDDVTVKVIGIDELGRINLSIKQVAPKKES